MRIEPFRDPRESDSGWRARRLIDIGSIVVLLAVMQSIPRDYYEAAMIDGAGLVRQFFSITIPQLRPTLIFVIVTSTIGGLQIFDEPRMFDQFGQGGASGQWMTITIYLYNLGWGQLNFGRAAAVAWLLFLPPS